MPQESIKILLFFTYWNRWRIYSQGFRTPPKFISHHPRPLIFIALTLEKTNTGSLERELFLLRSIPSSQKRRRETLVSPACLPCPWESSTRAPHGHTSERAAPDLGAAGSDPAQPSALRNRQQRGGWRAEGEGHRLTQHQGQSLFGLWGGGGGERNEQLDTPQPRQVSAPISLRVGPCSARALLWKRVPAWGKQAWQIFCTNNWIIFRCSTHPLARQLATQRRTDLAAPY